LTFARALVVLLATALIPTIANAQSMPGMAMPKASPKPSPVATPRSQDTPMPGMAVPTTSPSPVQTMPGMEMPSPSPVPTVPTVRLPRKPGWPSPVDDNPQFSYFIADILEFSSAGSGASGTRFDAYGWTGGDINRIWFKTEGFASSNPHTRDVEVSLLSGRLVKPFFDFQAGVRFVPGLGTKPSRTYAVVGYQGLAPYNFDIEPSLFVSQSGKVSARFTGSYDIPFTQRLILQPRLETNLAFQNDGPVGIGAGLNDVDFGLRLRYEIRREFAPYVGVAWQQKFGQTHVYALRDGPDRARFPVVAGLRVWF
jgi:copper resistance protein B